MDKYYNDLHSLSHTKWNCKYHSIFGHMFPVTMNFKGGKGLACLGGLILAYNPLLFVPVIAAIWAKHRINFRRIRYGVEMRFRYLWKKQEEEERIRANWNRLSEEERLYVGLTELDGADS